VEPGAEPVAARLDARLPRARQDHPVSRRHRLAVVPAPAGYRVLVDGREAAVQPAPGPAADAAYAHAHALGVAALPDHVPVHAACASRGGRRLLVVGAPGAGKSTLMARLLFEDFAVHGDDLVLVRGGRALPFPRRLGLRAPTLDLVPAVRRFAPSPPGAFYLDPAEAGFPWRITAAPVAAVVFLEPNHGGATRLAPCPAHRMAERVMTHSRPPAAGPRSWIEEVCGLLDQARCYTLYVGGLDEAVACVREVLGAHLAVEEAAGAARGAEG
jgi:hypothetical protein